MNILIASANDKRALIEQFRSALQALGLKGKVIAADSRDDAPAARYADRFVRQPEDNAADYAQQWLDLCGDIPVDLLVPTRDAELPAMTALKPAMAAINTRLLVAPLVALEVCLDKIRFYEFCMQHGFPVLPRIDVPDKSALPAFARFRVGEGSRSAFAVRSLKAWPERADDYLVQPWCRDREFSVDVLFSLAGKPLQAVVRERIEVVNGESVMTRVVDHPVMEELALKLCSKLGIIGPAVVQCFDSPQHGPRLIECNLRFGGASMVSVSAGLDSCERILLDVMGKTEQAEMARNIHYGQLVDRRLLPPGVFV